MGDEGDEATADPRRHRDGIEWLGEATPGTGVSAWGEALAAPGQLPGDLLDDPLIIDTDIGGDADDALAVAAAARRVPRLALVITGDEVRGERARFARYLLDLMGRGDVATVAGAQLGRSHYFCIHGLTPDTITAQADDVAAAVRRVAEAADGPLRWVGMGPLTNLARLLADAPELAPRLRVTQMGGALRYRDPDKAEHNIRLDVPSARAVLNAAAAGVLATPEFIASEVTFTPRIEVTAQSPLYARLRGRQAPPWAGVLADHLDRWFARFYPASMQHDALALSAALDLPFVGSDRMRIEMDAIGRTTQAPGGAGAPVRWSRYAAYEPFMTWLTYSLTAPADAEAAAGLSTEWGR